MKDKKILFVTAIILIFLMSVGLSYAYFSSAVTGNENAKNMVVETGTLKLTYTDSPEIIMQNIKPGAAITKEISVKNTGTLDTNYNLVWQELYNKIGRNDMVMSYSCERLNSSNQIEGTCDSLSEKSIKVKMITRNISIESGVTHKYIITIKLKETGKNQNYNQGKSFSGVLGIEEGKKIAGTLKQGFFSLSGQTDESKVKSISFFNDNRIIEGAEIYDVSEEKDNSIKMYMKTNSENSSLYDLYIVANGIIALPENSTGLFSFYKSQYGIISNIDEINFNNSIDTSNVTNMSSMFLHTTKLLQIDLSDFNTSLVTNMAAMFWNSGIKELLLNNFDTSKVTDMGYMLSNSFTSIDVSSFDTSNVTNMDGMFGAGNISVLDISNFDTSSVTNMKGMFSNMSNLETIFVGNDFIVDNVTDSSRMFEGCEKLKGGLGTTYDSNKIDKTYAKIDKGQTSPGYFTGK